MNIVDSVDISGFWATRHLKVRFQPDVNFLIGPNGSGKTTAINLIAAALNGDFSTLDRLQFDRIHISLSTSGSRRKPSIEVTKTESEKTPFPLITYRIRAKANDSPVTYALEDLGEYVSPSDPRSYYYYYRDARRRATHGVRDRLRDIV